MIGRFGHRRKFLSAGAAALFLATGPVAQASCSLADAEALLASRKSEARRMLEDCARSDPQEPGDAFWLGRLYLLDGDQDRAVAWLERASRGDGRNSEYQLWLGRAYGAQAIRASVTRQPSLARRVQRAFERAVELDPDNLAARLSLAEYELRAPAFLGGSSQKARAEAEEIRRRGSLEGHRAFGLIAEHEKRFDAAAEQYERAMKESPEASDPVYWRAELAERRKDYAAAFELLEALVHLARKIHE